MVLDENLDKGNQVCVFCSEGPAGGPYDYASSDALQPSIFFIERQLRARDHPARDEHSFSGPFPGRYRRRCKTLREATQRRPPFTTNPPGLEIVVDGVRMTDAQRASNGLSRERSYLSKHPCRRRSRGEPLPVRSVERRGQTACAT